ncbi:hypothetical protein B0O99DRAFT_687080 [Bisporella sp. PMI_857]|nr:hypothetical protein B0O99DRAFT_687080 [Bisporella sp. PMI_857]
MLFPRWASSPITFLSLLSITKATICYAPDGKSIASPDFQPCIAVDGVHSMCCGIVRDSNLDICQPNGLCLNTGKNSHFRDYCTDKTWSSPNCVPKTTCSDGVLGSSFIEMTACSDGSWCCGANNVTNCCNKKLGFQLKEQLVTFNADATDEEGEVETITATTTALSTTTVTATVTSAPTSAAAVGTGESNNNSNSSNDLTKTVTEKDTSGMVDRAVVIGLGVGLAMLALTGTAGGFYVGRRNGSGGPQKLPDSGNEGGHWGQSSHQLQAAYKSPSPQYQPSNPPPALFPGQTGNIAGSFYDKPLPDYKSPMYNGTPHSGGPPAVYEMGTRPAELGPGR